MEARDKITAELVARGYAVTREGNYRSDILRIDHADGRVTMVSDDNAESEFNTPNAYVITYASIEAFEETSDDGALAMRTDITPAPIAIADEVDAQVRPAKAEQASRILHEAGECDCSPKDVPEACGQYVSQGMGPLGDWEHSFFCKTCGWEQGEHRAEGVK